MNIDNRRNIKNEVEMCNHNYMDHKNTLVGIPKFKMVSPTTYFLRCKICNEIITVDRRDISDIKEFLHAFF